MWPTRTAPPDLSSLSRPDRGGATPSRESGLSGPRRILDDRRLRRGGPVHRSRQEPVRKRDARSHGQVVPRTGHRHHHLIEEAGDGEEERRRRPGAPWRMRRGWSCDGRSPVSSWPPIRRCWAPRHTQVRLLLAGFRYRIMHIQRAVLERVTGMLIPGHADH